MSVSLVALRIEIENNSTLVNNINFTASKYLMDNGDKRQRCKSENEKENEENTVKNCFSKEEITKQNRGSREMQSISVESIQNKDDTLENLAKPQIFKGNSSKEGSSESGPDSALTNSNKHNLSIGNLPLRSLNKIQFFSGNHYVEQTKGILHLYKENKLTPLGEEAERSELICILSVPTSMTVHDLCQFTAPFCNDIEYIRLIRDGKPNTYMVLIKFQNQKSADEFFTNFNGVPFNSIEPEVCHLVYVAKVEAIIESEEATLPIAGHTELPTCPVCLERMDESVEGILTILCNHSFHSGCLDKWGDNTCPVCRYSQVPESIPDNGCFECGSVEESLWICLICGHIGCGRYVRSHAYAHYRDTQHTYAMQIGSNNRVWDYAGDNYVHRLLQSKDGKPVEVQCNTFQTSDEKIDAVQLEYTYLLTNQLEAQRRYFEENISNLVKQSNGQIEELLDASKSISEDKLKLEKELNELRKEKQGVDKKMNKLQSKLNKLAFDYKEEKEINDYLRKNQDLWREKVDSSEKSLAGKEGEINELKEQIRDLMFFLEAKEKLNDVPEVTGDEIRESKVIISKENVSTSKSKAKSK